MGIIKYLRSKLMRKARRGRLSQEEEAGKAVGDEIVKRYSWDEIEELTENLAVVVGSGGFSTVYLARFRSGGLGAVKVHYGSERLKEVFKQELEILLQLRHDNIVRLLGYCDEGADGVGALVFEYVSSGTLQDKLHSSSPSSSSSSSGVVLPWWARARIAFQVAQSLEYLHDKCALHIIHGDLKSSNILIDHNLNSKLCDFGVAKLGFSSMVTPSTMRRVKMVMVGSPGYTDPYYLKTGMPSKMNDIYAFGIILLELVTGMQPFCPDRGQLLSNLAAPALHNLSTHQQLAVAELVDPQLKGNFDVEEVTAILHVAKLCLNNSPVLRPSATRVLHIIKDTIPSLSFSPPSSSSSSSSTDRKN